MSPGFLMVLSEPGEQVSLEEYQDWYDNEHVPLRMNHLPSFLTCARFSAADTLQPTWAALYDVDDISSFQHESYTRLRVTRSPREAELIARLGELDRRTCELVTDSGESELTTSLASRNPSKSIVTHTVELSSDQDFVNWTENTIRLLRGVSGWVRTRTFKYLDCVKTGTAVTEKRPGKQIIHKFLVVHELQDSFNADSPEFKNIIDTSAVELRIWNLHCAYPGIAQGNLE